MGGNNVVVAGDDIVCRDPVIAAVDKYPCREHVDTIRVDMVFARG